MAICRQLVQLMGGNIWVESESGQGSSFYFTAVFKRSEPPAPAADAGRTGSARPLRSPGSLSVLLAEDDVISQRVARAQLEQLGHTVILAGDGGEALAALERYPVDVVLMDVQMPAMDGLAATAAIRADPRWAHLPVIAMTAHAMKGDRERCLAAGMNDYISKPWHIEELQGVLDRHVGRVTGGSEVSSSPPEPRSTPAPAASAAPSAREVLILDRLDALARLNGNVEEYENLLQLWLELAPEEAGRLAGALAEGDAGALERAAHKLKGMSAFVGAQAVRQAALDLEVMGRTGDLAAAPAALSELQRMVQLTLDAIGSS